MLAVIIGALAATACGTVGRLATPTPIATLPPATPTATFTDTAKEEIAALFERQIAAIVAGEWDVLFATCSPDYRSRRAVDRLAEDLARYLVRLDVDAASLDPRNLEITKGRDDRFDLNYDLFIDGQYSQTVRVGSAYVHVVGEWYDDGVWCR